MTDRTPDDVDALLDCEPAFEALGATRPGDAAVLERVIGKTIAASPGPATGTAAGGLSTTAWLAVIVGVVALVAIMVWPREAAPPEAPEVAAVDAVPADAAPEEPAIASESPPPDPEPAVAVEAAIEVEAPDPVPETERPARPSLSAAQLLEQANAARRASQARRALALYNRLFKEHPRSREAATARVSAGRLALDQGKAKTGLLHFRKYLSANPQGSLAEEAAVGRAMALGRLGRSEAELEAWRTLLDKHPGTVHAARAKRRIDTLSAPEAVPESSPE